MKHKNLNKLSVEKMIDNKKHVKKKQFSHINQKKRNNNPPKFKKSS